MRTVFVFISGITSFTGLEGTTGFFASALGNGLVIGEAVTGGGGTGLLIITGAAGFAGAAGTVFGGAAGECVFPAAGFALLAGGVFLVVTGTGFLAGGTTTFFATGLAILLDTGAFLADLLPPDDWADLEAAFFAGAGFLTLVGFLAGFAAFFLVAIQLGFFSNKHF
ncbi:MAG TPA: hypothetical protein VNU72_10510 [Puia sp.]|nr:hypothetical protein [Puia sp.]